MGRFNKLILAAFAVILILFVIYAGYFIILTFTHFPSSSLNSLTDMFLNRQILLVALLILLSGYSYLYLFNKIKNKKTKKRVVILFDILLLVGFLTWIFVNLKN